MTKMKSKFLVIAAGVLLAACHTTAADEAYDVTVNMPEGMDGATAFMVNYDTGEKIDSVTIENSVAKFTGTVSKPALMRLIVDGNRVGNLILEGGSITVTDHVATGTPLNDAQKLVGDGILAIETQYYEAPQDSTGDALRQQIMARYDEYVDSVFLANADNPIGYVLFLDKAYSMSLSEIKATLEKYPAMKEYTRVGKLVSAAENKEKTSVGNKFTDFTVVNDSVTYNLSDYVGKGKPVLVDFWASWCGPCIRETKVIKEILSEFGPQGLEVLGVAVWDEPENTLKAVEQHQLPWQQIINAQSVPTDLYGISGIPCIILFGPDGTILSRDKQDAELKADVKAYFDGTLTAPADTVAAAK